MALGLMSLIETVADGLLMLGLLLLPLGKLSRHRPQVQRPSALPHPLIEPAVAGATATE